jgi:hypothetical protein
MRHFRTKLDTPAGMPAAHDEAFQNGPPADDADLVVIDLDPVNHGPDVGSPEWRLARQDIRSHHPDEFSDLLLSDPRLVARFSEGAVEYDLRDAPLVFYSGNAFLDGRIVRLAPNDAAISKPKMRSAFLLPPDRGMESGSPVVMACDTPARAFIREKIHM